MGPGELGPLGSGDLRPRYLAHIVVLKERQEANVAAGSDAFEQHDIPTPGIQLHYIVENIRHGFPGQEQVDEFLGVRERGTGLSRGDQEQKEKGGGGRKIRGERENGAEGL